MYNVAKITFEDNSVYFTVRKDNRTLAQINNCANSPSNSPVHKKLRKVEAVSTELLEANVSQVKGEQSRTQLINDSIALKVEVLNVRHNISLTKSASSQRAELREAFDLEMLFACLVRKFGKDEVSSSLMTDTAEQFIEKFELEA